MTATQQIENFTAFAKALTQQEGEEISLDEIYSRWWDKQHRDEDFAAIQEAVVSYEAGERGRPAEQFLTERRAARAKSNL